MTPHIYNPLLENNSLCPVQKIGLAFNMKKNINDPQSFDLYAEFDDYSTIQAISDSIKRLGYEVIWLEADTRFCEKLQESRPDFVFNIAEGIMGDSRESHIPAILAMNNIPYSGSSVLSQAITLNKARKKEILSYYNIPTPKFQLFRNSREKLRSDLRFPLIAKPNSEGSSKGIMNDCLVYDEESLYAKINHILHKYDQPVLVEEYCDGREFTVSLIGNNDNVRVLPIVEINYDHLPEHINKFDSYEVKWIYDNPESEFDCVICPAVIDRDLQSQIEQIALDTYKMLNIFDYCRMDIRLDSNAIPNVLDVNALPGLIPDPRENSRFPKSCYASGMTYDEIIREILETSMKRWKIESIKQELSA